MQAAIDALADAFADNDVEAPQRTRHETQHGDLLVMPAWSEDALGMKLVTVNPSNKERGLPLIHGMYILFDGPSMAPIALVDAEELTRIRTAAVSALATRHLAGSHARHLVVFGAGTQASGHIEAMCAIRPIERVTIVARTEERARRLGSEVLARHGVSVDLRGPEAVADADIICACTTSPTPLFDGDLLPDRVHINAVGSYRPDARELDDATMRRAGIVAVESRTSALAEAGDLVLAVQAGALDPERLVELARLPSTPAPPSGVTVFKSVGLALEDLAVARLATRSLEN